MRLTCFVCVAAIWALLAGCGKVDVSVSAGGSDRTIQARGVTYVVPWETSSVEDTPAGFKYQGDTLTATEIGGTLTVDGKRYGKVKPGAKVSLITKGTVLVNGTVRSAE